MSDGPPSYPDKLIFPAEALWLMWICTKGGSLPKIQNYETMKGGYLYQVKKVQNTKNIKLYTSDINFKLLYAGCPIAHAFTNTMGLQCMPKACRKNLLACMWNISHGFSSRWSLSITMHESTGQKSTRRNSVNSSMDFTLPPGEVRTSWHLSKVQTIVLKKHYPYWLSITHLTILVKFFASSTDIFEETVGLQGLNKTSWILEQTQKIYSGLNILQIYI